MAKSQSDTVHVFDTWVKGTKGLLHFDVMTTDEATALTLAKQHLASLGESGVPVTVKECQFCHTEPLVMFSPRLAKCCLASVSAVASSVVITSKCSSPFVPFTHVSKTCTVSDLD